MAALRHPCCGDTVYGADPALSRKLGLTRQWLHARSLGFAHPSSGEWLTVMSPFPSDLQHALDILESEA
jgi:23S rRNA pseudouridine1911/1915/1917 synthase